ncbi:MAG: MFS transporter [Pseudomonadota bacterium]
MNQSADSTAAPSLLKTVLGLERHEARTVGLSFAYFFCILSSYYIMRPVREAMGSESVEVIPYLFTSTFFVMLVASPAFAWIASRFPRQVFLPWVYLFFAANILLFYGVFSYRLANELSIVWTGRVFFVWISVFNLFVVSVFWSFMADIYTKDQGRRLFGLISAGGSLGALIGPFTTSAIVNDIGFQNLLPISTVLLLLGVACILKLRTLVDDGAGRAADEAYATEATTEPLGGSFLSGISQIARSKYFLAISVASLVASLLGTALYLFVAELVNQTVEGTNERTRLFGLMDTATNTGAFLLQLLVVKHAIRRLGLGATLAILPLVSVVGFAILAMNPTMMFAVGLQIVRRSVGFGFAKPTTDMLYSVVTPEQKYKAKNFIDTAIYRAGDVGGAWCIRALLSSGLGVSPVSLILVPFAAIWSFLALWLGRRYTERDLSGDNSQQAHS